MKEPSLPIWALPAVVLAVLAAVVGCIIFLPVLYRWA